VALSQLNNRGGCKETHAGYDSPSKIGSWNCDRLSEDDCKAMRLLEKKKRKLQGERLNMQFRTLHSETAQQTYSVAHGA
jgi:hypothetical protein